jgi:hypothetical protein
MRRTAIKNYFFRSCCVKNARCDKSLLKEITLYSTSSEDQEKYLLELSITPVGYFPFSHFSQMRKATHFVVTNMFTALTALLSQ